MTGVIEKVKQALQELHDRTHASLRDSWWQERYKAEQPKDPVVYQRVVTAAIVKYAAEVATDVQMDEEQFLLICRCEFQGAQARASKWG